MKKRKIRWAGKMVLGVLLISGGLAGCKSGEETSGLNLERVDESRHAILSTVPEPERRMAMLAIVDSMQAELKAVGADVLRLRQKIVEENRDYDTTRDDLEALYAQLGSQLETLTDSVTKHSLQLREHCSKSEWKKITSHETEAFQFKF